ncbi:discoidin domain-containing protein [Paenibacillus sp. J5C_2022]|uniref:discoidin domain-containing protein n=1 Tax=Paenibacillus sp. J5C2022 TaxID=2977129 RepID=UPI0021D07593|nr:discoidin domain-containing protein [Paenibacillus sp. J5C2022]MCU6708805.1 discoidin domain-containing protein [Paenibacillus sp. J5C2022]
MRKTLACLCCTLVVSGSTLMAVSPQDKVYADGGPALSFDLSAQGQAIENKFSDINAWDYEIDWTTKAAGQPSDYFETHYPFVKNVQFMTATGGCYIGFPGCYTNRDLFVDPSDVSNKTDYDFSRLIGALQHVVDQGLKPHIKTGNIPIKYSDDPHIGVMEANLRPPSDYDAYYNYIKALADALIAEFGLNEVKTWTWGVFTEYENPEWFDDGISANSTAIAFFKVYDYTVAALEEAIGAANLTVGAHSMTVTEGLWDELSFIDHVAGVGPYGTNYKTGGSGTQIDFLTASFYDLKPGITMPGGKSLIDTIATLRNRAVANGLTNLKYGIDEGRINSGTDSKALYSRIVGHTFQASSDAKQFRTMLDWNIDWFSSWGLSTEGLWGGVPAVSTHIADLGYRMVGDKRLDRTLSGAASDPSNEVDGIAGYDEATGTVHVMAYNHNNDMNSVTGETPAITIRNIEPVSGTAVTVKKWVVDDAHGNFWPTWWSDKANRGLTDASYSWSKYTMEVPRSLKQQADRDYWYSREGAYQSLAELTPVTTTATVTGNMLTLTPTLEHHGVVFYEITNARSVGTTMTDELNDWSMTSSHGSGLAIDKSNAAALGDASRAMRTSTSMAAQSIVYWLNGATRAKVTGLFATDTEPVIDNFHFYTSTDGTTWSPHDGWHYADSPINGGYWTKREYTLTQLPAGTNYVRIKFPTGGAVSYSPQLGKVQLSDVPWNSATVIDELDDWSKVSAHSPGLYFDTAHGAALGDSSRATRDNTNAEREYVIYRSEATDIQLTALYATDNEPGIANFSIYTAPDGVTWELQQGWHYTDSPINEGAWTKRTYTLSKLPVGTQFVKVEFPAGGTLTYSPQLSQVKLNTASIVNMAREATASASNTDTANGYSADKVNDGAATTDWSGWATDGTALPEWIQLDFGSEQTFSRVELYTTTGYAIRDYVIQYWNGSAWVDCLPAIAGNAFDHRTHTFPAVIGSKLRILGTSGPTIQPDYIRVNEIEVYSE